ncbi:acyltransferase domain-containing protein [Dyella sp. M7H15-1]|uniref:acyltransferase domain-containing protein n=1 Tax=Dyella sp. M7H15-1 TaxID=2501295 RepID=UPI0010051EF9|nr:acyltransferase domain-containing protein [Dyella sp. M7H15-1]QAU24897.1 acyltransferase domain-containing protein [Dyella sp. M7H15-1]
MHATTTALLFPGQGAYAPGCLQAFAQLSAVSDILTTTDNVARQHAQAPMSPLLLDPYSPPIASLLANDVMRLQLALYAQALAFGHLAAERAPRDTILIGHSLGEIPALTLANAWSVDDGAQIVVARTKAAQADPSTAGGMMAIAIGMERALHLVAAIGHADLAVAAANAPRQTVLSGTPQALASVSAVATALGIKCITLPSPIPFHNPLLKAAARQFHEAIRPITINTPERAVYSPIDGAFYDKATDIAGRIAGHFLQPVRFMDAIRTLHAWGVDDFIECSATSLLTRLVNQCVPHVQARTFSDAPHRAQTMPSLPVPPEIVALPASASRDTHVRQEEPPERKPADLVAELRNLYAEWLGYPQQYLTDSADLESDLGIDSLKQSELLARAIERYHAAGISDGFRIGNYPTLKSVAGYIQDHLKNPQIH